MFMSVLDLHMLLPTCIVAMLLDYFVITSQH